MGLFSGWQSAVSSAAQTIASLIGQDIVAKSISLSQAAAGVAVQMVTGARLKLGTGTTDFFTSDGATQIIAAGSVAVTTTLALRDVATVLTMGTAGSQTFRVDGSTGKITVGAGNGGSIFINATLLTDGVPTVVAGAGASVTHNNGTAAFSINLGGVASTGTITLPTATNGWVVYMQNVTHPDANVLGQTGGTQTTATFTNYVRTTGVAGNWSANDVANCIAFAF